MPQQALDDGDIHAGVEGQRGKGVPEEVRMHLPGQPGPLADIVDDALDGPGL